LSYRKNVKVFGASMPKPYLATSFRPKRDRRAELLFEMCSTELFFHHQNLMPMKKLFTLLSLSLSLSLLCSVAMLAQQNPNCTDFELCFQKRVGAAVNTPHSGPAEIILLDASGQTAARRALRLESGPNLISLEGLGSLPPGFYALRLVAQGGERWHGKAVKF
jgi:hypothetical protein